MDNYYCVKLIDGTCLRFDKKSTKIDMQFAPTCICFYEKSAIAETLCALIPFAQIRCITLGISHQITEDIDISKDALSIENEFNKWLSKYEARYEYSRGPASERLMNIYCKKWPGDKEINAFAEFIRNNNLADDVVSYWDI